MLYYIIIYYITLYYTYKVYYNIEMYLLFDIWKIIIYFTESKRTWSLPLTIYRYEVQNLSVQLIIE